MPEIIDPRQVAEITSLYHTAAVRIGGTLGRAIKGLAAEPESNRDRVRQARSASMLAEIDRHLATLGASARPRIGAASERVVARAKTFASAEMRRVGVGRAESGSDAGAELDLLGSPDDAAVRLVARDIVAMTEEGAADLRSSAERVFRSLQAVDLSGNTIDGRPVADALARLFIEGDPRGADRALRELFRDPNAIELESMRKLGNRQITVGGWTGEVRAYTATVLRTRSAEAANRTAIEQFVEADLDLGQIEGNNTTNFCTRFLGLIVALTSEAARRTGHPTVESLPGGGPPFHPNCSKLVGLYVEDVSLERDTQRGEAAARRYEAALRTGRLLNDLDQPLRIA